MLSRADFVQLCSRRVLVMDGAIGTLLMDRGLEPGQAPEALLLDRPDTVAECHRLYLKAGADILLSCTFGASPLKLAEVSLEDRTEEVNILAIKLVKQACRSTALAGASIGPSGRFLAPIGDLSFDDALDNFSRQARAIASAQPDLVVFETFSDLREIKAAIIAVRQVFGGPLVAHMTFQENQRTVTGTDPATAAAVLTGLGVDVIGANCSTGPAQILPVLAEMGRHSRLPLSVQPNAGMPQFHEGLTVYPGSPEEFAACVPGYIRAGASLIGGCCGSTPEYIKAVRDAVQEHPVERERPRGVRVASRTGVVVIGDGEPVPMAGERINPTARKRFREELRRSDMRRVREEAIRQVEHGAAILDVNVGVEGADQVPLMTQAVRTIQQAVQVPLMLDSQDPDVVEAGLKEVEGRCIINSVTAEQQSLSGLLPLAKKYGAAVIGLTLDGGGIPEGSEGRVRLASAILEACLACGLTESDLLIDCLVTAASADASVVKETLAALGRIKSQFGLATVLGISNVSHGLPERGHLNRAFLTMALSHGLDLPIVNPYSEQIREVMVCSDLLTGRDASARRFLSHFAAPPGPSADPLEADDPSAGLRRAIIEGDKDRVAHAVGGLLEAGHEPSLIADEILVKAMEDVGRRFDRKECFLPQVLLSSEAMHLAFDLIREAMKEAGSMPNRGRILMATVEGDIHDIGKNIVSAILASNGYDVVDLGKSVSCDRIIEEVKARNPAIVGLSALMTTTMPQMRLAIERLRSEKLPAKVITGGAAVTKRYSEEIGADGYARSAVDAVSVVRKLLGQDPGNQQPGARR